MFCIQYLNNIMYITASINNSSENRNNIRIQRRRTHVFTYRSRDTGLELVQTGVS